MTQLYNILVGDLSLVGPQPEAPEIFEFYSPAQREILSVRPGLTSPGFLGYLKHQFSTIPEDADTQDYFVEHLMDPKLQMDLKHILTTTLSSDTRVLAQILLTILRSPSEA